MISGKWAEERLKNMANILQMMKQAATMKRDMKKIQDELARKTVDFSAKGGQVRVTARGDMSIAGIQIDPALVNPAQAARLGEILTVAVNGALDSAKKEAGREMAKLTQGMGLGDLLGG